MQGIQQSFLNGPTGSEHAFFNVSQEINPIQTFSDGMFPAIFRHTGNV
jgi:hypothetical protein